jgi:WD40 repeat protein
MVVLEPPLAWRNSEHVLFDPNGGLLVVAYSGYGLALFATSNWGITATHEGRASDPSGVLISPERGYCFVPSGHHGLVRLSYPDLVRSKQRGQHKPDAVRFACISRDGRYLVHTLLREAVSAWIGGIAGYTLSAGQLSPLWEVVDPEWRWLGVDFLPSGNQFVAVEYGRRRGNRRLTLRSATTGGIESELSCHGKEISSVMLSPSGSVLVGRSQSSVWIWHAPEWSKKPMKLQSDSRKRVTAAAFHPSGKHLAATSNDGTAKLYDTTTWRMAKSFSWNIGEMRSIAFSPDGTLAAAGSDSGKVVVWDVDL